MVQGKPYEIMSKAEILNSISKNKPAPLDLPVPRKIYKEGDMDLLKEFIDKAESAGADTENFDSFEKVEEWIKQLGKNGKSVINLTQLSNEKDQSSAPEVDPDKVEMVVIRGQMGVAENGAVWIDEHDMQIRNLPFVTSHLVLILEKSKILPDLHEAYKQVDLDGSGFGVFIAGPSKTADIEQALVIGAHGPIKHTILLY
jgi:L-lactate dehydrogenase complex protein LldG